MSLWNFSSNSTNSDLSSAVGNEGSYRNDYIVGSLFFVTSFFGLVTYIPCMVAMYKSPQLKSPVYTFMISLGVSDCTSLVGWLIIAVDTYTHGFVVPKPVITVVLCFLVIGWGSLTTHEAMVAINRLVAVCFSTQHDVLFSKKRMTLLLGISWFYAICIHAFATFLPPNMYYSLDGYYAVWASDTVTLYYTYEDITCCSIVFTICVTCYISIIAKYTKVRKQITPKMLATQNNNLFKERKDFMFQFRLALQMAVRCLTFFVYDLLYYIVSLYSTNLWAVFIYSTYLWCLNNALNPWVYLCFNKQLRNALRRTLFPQSDIPTETTRMTERVG